MKIIMAKNWVSFGCTSVSIEVIKFILMKHEEKFPKEECIELQTGKETILAV